MHICRGNFKSMWIGQGGYEPVADALFNQMDIDGYFLEFDSERAGGFEPLRFVPKNKMVVLGLVTTKCGELESKDCLKRRIEEASRFVDCGQHAAVVRLPELSLRTLRSLREIHAVPRHPMG